VVRCYNNRHRLCINSSRIRACKEHIITWNRNTKNPAEIQKYLYLTWILPTALPYLKIPWTEHRNTTTAKWARRVGFKVNIGKTEALSKPRICRSGHGNT